MLYAYHGQQRAMTGSTHRIGIAPGDNGAGTPPSRMARRRERNDTMRRICKMTRQEAQWPLLLRKFYQLWRNDIIGRGAGESPSSPHDLRWRI